MAKKEFNTYNVTLEDFIRDTGIQNLESFSVSSLTRWLVAYIDALNTDKDFDQDILCEKAEGAHPCDDVLWNLDEVCLNTLQRDIAKVFRSIGYEIEEGPNTVRIKWDRAISFSKFAEYCCGVVNGVCRTHDWRHIGRFRFNFYKATSDYVRFDLFDTDVDLD